ncbi:MAG TPA: topoisomerase DNA-binding C4 zinc finger domain-containing protein, partial [Aquabacterium sp.]|nr:topoisomerase DNA-binding C4 zinc finger domain-containing protein [Aquabacterium sp.]
NIELIDGAQVLPLLDAGKQALALKSQLAPTCPKCHADMKLRQARKGPQAGHEFWGCSRFPDCRGTLPHEPSI